LLNDRFWRRSFAKTDGVANNKQGKLEDSESRHRCKGMLNGLEAEVALVVDVMLPTERLVDAIRAFEREFPTVALRLHVEALAHRNKVLAGARNTRFLRLVERPIPKLAA
jgi:hypothetical protein